MTETPSDPSTTPDPTWPFEAVPGLDGGLLPDHDGRGIANVAASLAEALGADPDGLLPPLDEAVLPPGLVDGVEQVVLLVVDGLGWEAYREAADRLQALPALAEAGAAAPITSVLPSTTATALTSLHHGVGPARHGMVGPYARLADPDVVANLLRWTSADGTADLRDRGLDPSAVVATDALPELLASQGVDAAAVTLDDYTDSPLSAILYQGATVRGFPDLPSLPQAVAGAAEDVDDPGLVLAYWDGLDATGHLRGPDAEAWDHELDRVDGAVADLAEALPPETLLLVTSDHGFVPTPAPLALDLDDHPDLRDRARWPPTGEVRWRYLETDEPEAVRAYVDDRLDHALDVLDQEKLLEAGAYGPDPPDAAVRARYGDLVLVPRGKRSLRVRYQAEPPPHLDGHHGGPTAREALVPFVAARPGR